MGFKEIRDFNLAMLGRQGWRLLKFENSLVGRVFKARYCPIENLLTAKIRNNPSYIWRSILEAQTLFKRGSQWRIGDGSNVNVQDKPWLLNKHNPFIISRHLVLQGTRVENLMIVEGNQWEKDIIEDLFEEQGKNLIYSIQLNPNKSKDPWYWIHELNGAYSVKIAYKEVQTMHNRWEENETRSIWQKIWNLKVPANFKTFIKRTLTNYLPTRRNLQSKILQIAAVCPLYGIDAETTKHCPGYSKQRNDILAYWCCH